MKTEIRFAKASDKKDFVELALNRDKAINEPPRKDYCSKKFRSLPKSNRLL
ncbi:MAG: hypothetical protein HY514_00315, partial [Candidatus Aenigmarchaeota archaeon]|nr:hypothetical protein [Candidatus Aenigmarchaeota archaeon]